MRPHPALDVIWAIRPADDIVERMLAEIDDAAPTAVEERPGGVRVFFASPASRAKAAVRLIGTDPGLQCTPVEVPDEDWAARSQAGLLPVRVGRIVVTPAKDLGGRFPGTPLTETTSEVFIAIVPSMGFGTGHHASTRLCLDLMQQLPIQGARVLDVGTGSGILALAAARLGAASVTAIDYDADAIQSARENLERNDATRHIALQHGEFAGPSSLPAGEPAFDLVLANLTDAGLIRQASALSDVLARPGRLIVSGFLLEQKPRVLNALRGRGFVPTLQADEDGWAAAVLTTTPTMSKAR